MTTITVENGYISELAYILPFCIKSDNLCCINIWYGSGFAGVISIIVGITNETFRNGIIEKETLRKFAHAINTDFFTFKN